ncbi:MAG: potassium/proton antiporter [Bacteroidetes bacterium]|uniref:Potassium/proton antiporter n=1 Tax=Candidatus Cryptobacteroides merdigallinarum TaxID=2840770 RepID=A0A9D9HEP2_9BACT|nr:potassium/proton antiporter [Candidatus Cryptobacteroides merdigallinarum]
MTFTSENVLLILSVLIFSSILISKAGYRFGLPSLLLFLVAGMLFGVDGLGLQFNDVKQAQFIGMCSLCVILFSGGMETKIKEIRPVLAPGLMLSTLGVVLTTVFTGLFIFVLSVWDRCPISLPLVTCLLLAATMSSTDSASVFNILRNSKMRLKNNLQPMLELESGSNDPMAYILTIILIQLANALTGDSAGSLDSWSVAGDAFRTLLLQFGVGILGGAVFGFASVWFLRRVNLNNAPLYAILLLSVMFFSYTATTYLSGNGYLAVYLAGIIIGNKSIPYRKDILSFFDGMTWLVQIFMFLILGLLVNPHEMLKTGPVALLIGIFMILVARPLSVFISLAPFRKISTASKSFISWVGLRGAAPILFATYPVVENVEGADLIFNIVFFITLLSLIIQGSSITGSARLLKLNEDMPEEENTFGVEVPEEAGKLVEITLTEESLLHGNTLKELKLPEGMLVMMIKRQDKFIVPNGSVELQAGDRLLIISDHDNEG